MPDSWARIQHDIVACERCPRLRNHCTHIAQTKRRAYAAFDYWGKPVPGFGDTSARVLLLGLAPGAHGSNRTGRMFTGDKSGDWLYRALFDAGFASQPGSSHRADGLTLSDCFISAACRCAPPDNKPLPAEVANCREYLEREFRLLKRLQIVVALGRLAFDTFLSLHALPRSAFHFAHNQEHATSPLLISSYHPSQQNTSTGKLTREMLAAVFERVRARLQ